MIAHDVLALLRCPESRQPLAAAAPELIARLETRRAAGELRDRSGNAWSEKVAEGLVREDGALFFPVRDGIPVLIAGEALDLRFGN